MKIITISRQFGSGGRELGKRLADVLGWDYYDREIITQLAEESGLNPEYVSTVLSRHEWHEMHITYRNSFNTVFPEANIKNSLLVRQRKIIEEIAKAGNDCIIVGRNADIILADYKPFRIYVCAGMKDRVARCMKHENKKPEAERLSERRIKRNIKRIDRERAQVREMLTGMHWGDTSCFDLTINAGGRDLKMLSHAVADFAGKWFEQ